MKPSSPQVPHHLTQFPIQNVPLRGWRGISGDERGGIEGERGNPKIQPRGRGLRPHSVSAQQRQQRRRGEQAFLICFLLFLPLFHCLFACLLFFPFYKLHKTDTHKDAARKQRRDAKDKQRIGVQRVCYHTRLFLKWT